MNYFSAPGILEEDKTKSLIVRICKEFRITEVQIKSNTKEREFVFPRQIAMYILHKNYKINSVKVGSIFKRDHATVLYSCKAIAGYMEFDKKFETTIKKLT